MSFAHLAGVRFRNVKRLLVSFSILCTLSYFISVMSYNSESRLSEYILDELYKRYTDSRLEAGFPDREIICKEYFGFLHTVHSDWKIRSFDN